MKVSKALKGAGQFRNFEFEPVQISHLFLRVPVGFPYLPWSRNQKRKERENQKSGTGNWGNTLTQKSIRECVSFFCVRKIKDRKR